MKLSVVLATFNEEKNIGNCLKSIQDIASEIIVVDGSSSDKTVEIARSMGAKVIVRENPRIFHINKQIALEEASNTWVLQLDADERVSERLATEIKAVVEMTEEQISEYQEKLVEKKLFLRNQKLLEERDGPIGLKTGDYVAFFLPRLNFFLGRFLRYGGVYPDGAIRLVKKGKAFFPCKDVHEIMTINGKVGWLQSPLFHIDSPTFLRYLEKNSRYISLLAQEYQNKGLKINLWNYLAYFLVKPLYWLVLTLIRHKGILDSWQGLIFAVFSSLRFPRAYWLYMKNFKK